MHRMTWYMGIDEIMVMGFLYRLHFMVNVCLGALDPVVFVTGTTIAKWLVITGCTSLVTWAT
jgi:hypothetical protein